MSKKVLIVDDEQIIRTVLKRILSGIGIASDLADDGQDALKRIDKKQYDLIILDILMPKINGISFLKEINQIGYKTNVIVISACSENQILDQIRELGVSGYLKKPFDNIDLVTKAVKEVLQT
jgi:CheY-like chemotaxis protein